MRDGPARAASAGPTALRGLPLPACALRAAMAAFGLVALGVAAHADTGDETAQRCAGTAVEVVPVTSPLAPRVCRVAAEIRPVFARLGLAVDTPVTVRPMDEATELPPGCVAFYDTGESDLHVLSVECLSDADQRLGSFRDLPPDRMFDSLIVHELTHAYLDGIKTEAPVSRLAHEYLAYALQLDSLSDADRELVRSHTTIRREITLDDFSELLLGFHPLRFAVFAWLHFSAEPNKREAVARLIDGRTKFTNLR